MKVQKQIITEISPQDISYKTLVEDNSGVLNVESCKL